ncbi:aspartate aminotransferase family protein [Evansella sp. AB-P1]|uniref:aminotransferase family protein n=1 Tax=Evansella sp. AB-P1 TaxID=3037653 RepID=UPI00241CA821|nr:aspartate aminotransferase family protein [Evansella sp. AB-P1]MDG5788611.1 aspartate aminotransferase family protein [Evansella sp. AB-P1]
MKLNNEEYTLWHPFINIKDLLNNGIEIIEGEGIYIKDVNGKSYINGFSGLSLICGLGNTEIVDAVYKQMKELAYCSMFGMTNNVAKKLADKLVNIAPPRLEKVLLTNSGSEAIEASIKIARQYFKLEGYDNKNKIIALKDSFHGTTYGSFSASGVYRGKEHEIYKPIVPGFLYVDSPYCYRCPFNLEYPSCDIYCASHIETTILKEDPETIAALLIEPILGAGGLIIPPKNYFEKIVEICDRYNILLIMDESATGFGRTGKLFGSNHWEITPDMMVLSKGINSGYLPLGALLVSGEIHQRYFEKDEVLTHGTSQSGNPSSCAAGIATINILIRDQLVENSLFVGDYLLKICQKLKEYDFVGDVRGIGLMFMIEFISDKQKKDPLHVKYVYKIYLDLLEEGLIVHFKGNRIGFFPPLIINKEEIEESFYILNKVMKQHQRRRYYEYG